MVKASTCCCVCLSIIAAPKGVFCNLCNSFSLYFDFIRPYVHLHILLEAPPALQLFMNSLLADEPPQADTLKAAKVMSRVFNERVCNVFDFMAGSSFLLFDAKHKKEHKGEYSQ